MACNAPLAGWKAKERNPSGKRGVVFDLKQGISDLPINLACGKCFGCRLAKSREWALRCTHEAQMYDNNSFLTLTYNDKNLPPGASLRPEDFTLFMKKLRRRSYHLVNGKKIYDRISYFQCGEYGEDYSRPHHHCMLFNRGFPDRKLHRRSGKYNLFRSGELEEIWTMGHSEIGDVTFESAGYVARYTLAKASNKQLNGRHPEYLTMSRNPGLGKTWLKEFHTDVYPSDQAVTRSGQVHRPPRYYDEQLLDRDPVLHEQIRVTRLSKLTDEMRSGANQTARERILRARARERK